MKHVLLALLICLVLGASRADAAMMVHYDLAGLLLQADSVVIADRVQTVTAGQGDERGQYKVVRSLRGTRKPGELVEVYDRHFVTRGHKIDARAVLFLDTQDGKPRLVPSGLRVIENGKVWRFQQFDNPGPYVMVVQGKDPDDQWENGGAQLDLAGLERAIDAAQKRIDALAAAKAIADPAKRRAAVLALFAAGGPAGGFYVDLLAERARTLLANAGDLEGALLVDLRDSGMSMGARDFATVPALVAIAVDPKRSVEVRAAALAAADRGFALTEDFASLEAIAKLIDDPAPAVRAAAIVAAAHPASVITSDQAQQRKLAAWTTKIRGVIAKRYATETEPRVLAAILDTYEGAFRKPPPARAGGPQMIAIPSIVSGGVGADVYCLQPLVIDDATIVLRANGVRATNGWFSLSLHCKGISGVGGPGTSGSPLPGTYDMAVEITVKGKAPVTLPLGRVTFDANGQRRLVP